VLGDYQNEIYLLGMTGQGLEHPLVYAGLEEAARELLSPEAYAYVAGAAGNEDTLRANLEEFRRWRIVPRMARDVSERDLSTEVLGLALAAPLMLAPVGVLGILHEEAEIAVARACAELGVPAVLSNAASTSMEDFAEAMGDTPRWFQLYWPNEADIAASFVSRAEAAGYGAIVVTLDTPTLGWRPRDLAGAYLPFLKGEGIANYTSDPVFRAAMEGDDEKLAAVQRWVQVFPNPGLTWERLDFIREHTNLPIVLKGILHPDDARRAADAGVEGIVVSNHGGRQVDGAIAALAALPRIVEALPDDYPVLFDSGIRGGADILKAVALGARAVLIGRPYAWGLAVAGSDGVKQVLRALLAELDLTLALSGHSALATLGPDVLVCER
jgi:isopentenyl diphosphate isomerase/L-lactate dehydrogenase-like FMN-dependent dehydrogenase